MRGTSIAVLLAGLFALTACTTTQPAPAAPAPLPSYATAREALTAAVARTVATTSAYSTQDGETRVTTTGVSDPARRAVRGTTKAAMATIDTTVIGDDMWVRGLPMQGNTWSHISLTRAPLATGAGLPAVVAAVAALPAAIADVRQTGPGAFEGTVDPTEVAENSLLYAAKAGPLPFAATIDAQGYLTTVVLHTPPLLSTLDPGTVTVHLTDVGKPVTITAPPAAEVKELNDEAYAMYGGA